MRTLNVPPNERGRHEEVTPAMYSSLRLVNERFHQVREELTRLFDRDADFRDLCEEYKACTEVMTRLQSGGPSSVGMRNEYASLLLRLERELLRYLGEHSNPEES